MYHRKSRTLIAALLAATAVLGGAGTAVASSADGGDDVSSGAIPQAVGERQNANPLGQGATQSQGATESRGMQGGKSAKKSGGDSGGQGAGLLGSNLFGGGGIPGGGSGMPGGGAGDSSMGGGMPTDAMVSLSPGQMPKG
ncbi:hypothetical protein FCH28_16280 [Streptomyces piniterrae]|uniref:Uncharacterized protein n=1 Tax=Streptomyces piniterrae TaxID=2571125 RepID=A0A4V5MKD0_9ACTN|nr:hypothetical protein [Streptomyces piniterrae]TJZ52748.1 hypothetical protein FCH28_16280 [Streptomyces piniterrae]